MNSKRVLSPLLAVCAIAFFVQCNQVSSTESNEISKKSEQEDYQISVIKEIHAEIVRGNLDIFDKHLADNYVRHCQAMPPELQTIRGAEPLKKFIGEFINGVSEYKDEIGPIFSKGNMIAYVSTMQGIHTGEMNGLPASNKPFSVVNVVIHRFEDGKVAESWVSWDNVAVLSQLGYFPPPQQETQTATQ